MGTEKITAATATTTNPVELTKKEKKALKKAGYNQTAEQLIAEIAGKSNATTSKGVEKFVLATLEDNKANYSKEEYKAIKKAVKKGNWFTDLFGKKPEARMSYDVQARGNVEESTKTELFNKGWTEFFSPQNRALIDAAGFSEEQLYAMIDEYQGTDNLYNYSYKQKQVGEQHGIVAAFNQNANGVKFTKEQVKSIVEEMTGNKWEKAVRPEIVTRDAVLAAAGASPAGILKVTQHQEYPGLINAVQHQSMQVAWAAPALGAVIGTTAGIIKEYTRVEDRIADQEIPSQVKTYDDYAKFMNTCATEKGAKIMNQIAKFYDTEKGFDQEGLANALNEAAGENSVLNYEEAVALRDKLLREGVKQPAQQPAQEQQQEEQQEQIPEYKLATYERTKTVDDTACYKVKAGDNWSAVVEAKYGAYGKDMVAIVRQLKDAYYEANKEELNKKGITSSKGAFFPKAGEELCIPDTITVNGKEYSYDGGKETTAGIVDDNYKGVNMNTSTNPFLQEKTTYYLENEMGTAPKGYDTKDARQKEIDKIKAEKGEKVNVTVHSRV